MTQYFPQGIATGKAFCNREQERAALAENIRSHENVVLAAPRRYGKTSLITQVLKENKFHGKSMDFFFVLSQEDVLKVINEGVSEIINSLLPKAKKTTQSIIDFIRGYNPKIMFAFMGQQLEISLKQKNEKTIAELLLALDQFLEKTNQSCALVFDEFQQIGELKENHAIEAAIRHAAERSRFVSYIFCGSKRHLLHEMFRSRARPLYHLCHLITIDRISTQSYQKFLRKLSIENWGRPLSEEAFDEIILLTQNHPYYVNGLCRQLWKSTVLPTISDVRNIWSHLVEQQSAWINDEIATLSLNRKKVLHSLSHQTTKEPQGQAFSNRTGINPSGTKAALHYLLDMDFVYRDRDGFYRILDPAVSYHINNQS